MKSLAHTLIAIQEIANNFDGGFTLKNAQGKYFYANDSWLKLMKMKQEELIGKTDDELFPPEHAELSKKTDQQVFENKELLSYTGTLTAFGEEITYIALKWAVKHKNGDVFCYCTMGDLEENRERIMAIQPKIQEVISSYVTDDENDMTDNPEADIHI
ncbi:MAG: putative sensor protein [Crocinitomicaceae bacterium]|jgi:PAS domain S-box-containing protein|nr:putative sensor protein [Crocinitomicaceae bacterium]